METWLHNGDRFRQVEKVCIMSLIEPGTVVQVCGPPMVGKSTLVNQAVEDYRKSKQWSTTVYDIMCKNINSVSDLFTAIMAAIPQQQHLLEGNNIYPMKEVLLSVQSTVSQRSDQSHVFIFHKCEKLHSPESDLPFLNFLYKMVGIYRSHGLKLSIVLTTYKKFHISGRYTKCANIGMLTDPLDIHFLLSRHTPGVIIKDYIYVCQTALCLPEAVIKLSQRYLSDKDKVHSMKTLDTQYPGILEQLFSWDTEFFHQLFKSRTDDVINWVPQEDLQLLAALGQSSFTEEHFRSCFKNLYPEASHTLWFFRLTKLTETYVIREVSENGRLAVHPLVVHYIHICRPQVHLSFTEEDGCNSRNFMNHVILKTEENMRKHGRKGQLYGCHVQDWPVIQHLLQMAIHCQSYRTLLQVAVLGRNLIISCYPNESRQFYSMMYNSAKMIGSPNEAAVMEICLAQATVSGKDVNWSLASKHLDSAIETLKIQGPDFFYKTAIRKKAKLLENLGDHLQSIEFYQKAKEKVECPSFTKSNEALYVTDLQTEEDNVSAEIQEIFPLIFTGNNTEAKEKLMDLFENIQDRYEHHPEYADILNAIGLTTQRGTKDMDQALFWYQKSHSERKHLKKIYPQFMLRTLNNMAMILCRKGNLDKSEKYLLKALDILRENCWYQYYTALTLTHLSEVKVKQRDFQKAFDLTLQAEHILMKTTKKHDFRLKINQSLLHHRLVLGQAQSSLSTSVEDYIDKLIDLGHQEKNHLSDDGHHYLMSAYEHGMFLHLHNSEDKFNYYKRNLFFHVEENQFLGDILYRKNLTKAPSSLLSEHRKFLEYLANTEYKDYTFETFLSFILKSCPMCRNIREVNEIRIWSKEIDHLKEERLKCQKDLADEFSLLSDCTFHSMDSFEIINLPDISSLKESHDFYKQPPEDVANRKKTYPSVNDHKESCHSSKVINLSTTTKSSNSLVLLNNDWSMTDSSWEVIQTCDDDLVSLPKNMDALNLSEFNGDFTKSNYLEGSP